MSRTVSRRTVQSWRPMWGFGKHVYKRLITNYAK